MPADPASERVQQVATLVAQGLTRDEVARRTGLARDTVNQYVSAARRLAAAQRGWGAALLQVGRLTIHHTPEGTYVVVRDGVQVGGVHSSREHAHTAAENRHHREMHRARPCLRCGATFQSEGCHNRLCAHCRRMG